MERRSSFAARSTETVVIPSSPSRPSSTRNLILMLPSLSSSSVSAIRTPISSVSLDPTSLNSSPREGVSPKSVDLRNNFLGAMSAPATPQHPPSSSSSSPTGRLFEQPAVPPTTAFTKKFPELLMAIRIGHVSRCALLLEKSPGSANAIDADGTPALMRASMLGHADIISLLIHRGAYTERRDPKGYTSLLHACERGKAKAVKALLDGGANPRVNTRQLLGHKFEILDDDTPMGLATEYGHTDVITVLQNFSIEEEKREQAKERDAKARRRKGLDVDEPIKTRAEVEKERKRKEDEAIAASNPEVVRVKESTEIRSLGLDDALNIAEEAEAAIRAAGRDGDMMSSTPNSFTNRRRHSMAAFTVAAGMMSPQAAVDDSEKRRKDDEKSRRASMSEVGADRQRRHSMAEMRDDDFASDFGGGDDTGWGGARGKGGRGRQSWGDYIRNSLRIVTPKMEKRSSDKQIIGVGPEMRSAVSSPLMEAAAANRSYSEERLEGEEEEVGKRRNKEVKEDSKKWCSIV